MIRELSNLGKTRRDQKTEDEWVHFDALKEEPISMEVVIVMSTWEMFPLLILKGPILLACRLGSMCRR